MGTGTRPHSRTPSASSCYSSTEPLPAWRIIFCAAAMCGIQVCYAAQINLGTAELLRLGISRRVVSLAWLAGPLSGLIVQPLVGAASDACTSPYGRRRPFLVGGTVFTASALLMFSYSTNIVSMFVEGTAVRATALKLAIVAFFLLDFSIQAIQAPLRALVTDVIPKKQRAFANAFVGVFTGLGNFFGGFLTGLELTKLLPWFETEAQALFSIAVMVLFCTVAMCVFSTSETPLRVFNLDGEGSVSEPGELGQDVPLLGGESDFEWELEREREMENASWWETLTSIPRPFWQVFSVQMCTWCGFFSLFVYVNTWVGQNVYLGDGSAPDKSWLRERFEEGVRLGGNGNALTALLTLAYSLFLPRLLRRFGTIGVYSFSQVVEAGCLLAAPWIRGFPGEDVSTGLKVITLTDIGLFGIVWATTMGVPWTIVGDALESDPWYAGRVGFFTTLFNASQSAPQLFVAFLSPVVLSFTDDDPAYVMFAGGVCALLGAVLVVALRVDEGEDNVELVDLGDDDGSIF